MQILSILRIEIEAFLVLLAAVLVWKLLTRQINLQGLLRRKGLATGSSPERVQLLLATLAMSANYLGSVLHSSSNSLPDISSDWLYVFGGSSAVYAAGKALTELKTPNKDLER